MFHIYDIKINELENPLGLDIKSPRFSWKLRSEKQNTMQKKAQILVGTTPGAVSYTHLFSTRGWRISFKTFNFRNSGEAWTSRRNRESKRSCWMDT